MASGAQILSTDYPKAEPAKWTGYSVSFAGGAMARCNPVAKNAECVDSRSITSAVAVEPFPARSVLLLTWLTI